MSNDLLPAVIFGAGAAGCRAKVRLASRYHILAFVDNDKRKQATTIDGIQVWSKARLTEKIQKEPSLKILIGSEFSEQIFAALSADFPSENIEVLCAADMAKLQFGDSAEVHQTALLIASSLSTTLRSLDIVHHIDAGTLLGLYRDGRLIPWDDDLDFAIDSSEVEKVLTFKDEILSSLKDVTHTAWTLNIYKASIDYHAISAGDIRAVKLEPQSDTLPGIDFFVKYQCKTYKDYLLASRAIRMPAQYSKEIVNLEINGDTYPIPKHTADYLQYHYGDWRTPQKGWALQDLSNTKVFNS